MNPCEKTKYVCHYKKLYKCKFSPGIKYLLFRVFYLFRPAEFVGLWSQYNLRIKFPFFFFFLTLSYVSPLFCSSIHAVHDETKA